MFGIKKIYPFSLFGIPYRFIIMFMSTFFVLLLSSAAGCAAADNVFDEEASSPKIVRISHIALKGPAAITEEVYLYGSRSVETTRRPGSKEFHEIGQVKKSYKDEKSIVKKALLHPLEVKYFSPDRIEMTWNGLPVSRLYFTSKRFQSFTDITATLANWCRDSLKDVGNPISSHLKITMELKDGSMSFTPSFIIDPSLSSDHNISQALQAL